MFINFQFFLRLVYRTGPLQILNHVHQPLGAFGLVDPLGRVSRGFHDEYLCGKAAFPSAVQRCTACTRLPASRLRRYNFDGDELLPSSSAHSSAPRDATEWRKAVVPDQSLGGGQRYKCVRSGLAEYLIKSLTASATATYCRASFCPTKAFFSDVAKRLRVLP